MLAVETIEPRKRYDQYESVFQAVEEHCVADAVRFLDYVPVRWWPL